MQGVFFVLAKIANIKRVERRQIIYYAYYNSHRAWYPDHSPAQKLFSKIRGIHVSHLFSIAWSCLLRAYLRPELTRTNGSSAGGTRRRRVFDKEQLVSRALKAIATAVFVKVNQTKTRKYRVMGVKIGNPSGNCSLLAAGVIRTLL